MICLHFDTHAFLVQQFASLLNQLRMCFMWQSVRFCLSNDLQFDVHTFLTLQPVSLLNQFHMLFLAVCSSLLVTLEVTICFLTTMSGQQELRELWLTGPPGQLCALEQAKAWVVREVWRSENKGSYGMNTFIAERVVKGDGSHPSGQAVSMFFDKFDNDDDWFPGKQHGQQRGRKRVLTGVKAAAVCRSAKALKRSGAEVTYPLVCANAPQAVRNPSTGEPVDKRSVYDCLRAHCYDKTPDKTWANRPRLGRKALTSDMVLRRMAWAEHMLALPYDDDWYFDNVVWVDICSSLLPTTAKKAAEQALARKGNRVWCSEDALSDDENLRGDVRVLKMNSWDIKRVWWMPVLCQGKLHISQLPDDFPGDRPAGAATFVKAIRSALNVRFRGEDMPKVLFTDRGAGFFNAGNGRMTEEFKVALAEQGLRAFQGESAAV